MGLHISNGNSKLGTAIPCVNLAPITTCRKNAPCSKECYACKGRFRFDNVRNSIKQNTEFYKANPRQFFAAIDIYLNGRDAERFRWHSSGDIPDANYFMEMCKLARRHKGVRFLCFTKKYEIVNEYLDSHRKPANLTVVFSNWGEWKCENPHHLPTSCVEFKDGSGDVPKNARKCSGFCGNCPDGANCWSLHKGQSVVFKQH